MTNKNSYSLNKKEKSRKKKRAIYTVTCMDQGVTIMCDVYCNTRCCHIVDCVISAFLTNISFLNAHLAWCQKISLGIWTIVIKFYSQSLARGKGVVITDWVLAHVINHPLRLLHSIYILSVLWKSLSIFYLYSKNLCLYSIFNIYCEKNVFPPYCVPTNVWFHVKVAAKVLYNHW